MHTWWIDAQTGLTVQTEALTDSVRSLVAFTYSGVNSPLDDAEFAIPQEPGLVAQPPDALDADYDRRFLNVRDGSDGYVSLRWGKTGPKGRSSSGLN